MSCESSITKDTLNQVIGNRREIGSILDEVVGYNHQIVKKSLSALMDPQLALNTWVMFANALDQFPFTIPMGNKYLSDYPEIIRDVDCAGFEGFYGWFKDLVNNNERLEKASEQAVMRNVFHFFEYVVRLGDKIPSTAMETMRAEFHNADFSAPTKWLSRFCNGLQTSLIEVYVAEKFMSGSLSSEHN